MNVRFVRFCGALTDQQEREKIFGVEARRSLLEFGTVTNFEEVCTMMDMGFTFSPVGSSDDRTGSRETLEAAMVRGEIRFGQFPVTIALGSGDSFRFSEER